MARHTNGHLRPHLQHRLQARVREFRELEKSENLSDSQRQDYERQLLVRLRGEPPKLYRAILRVMIDERCSFMVATAAVFAFAIEFSDDDFDLIE